MFFLPFSFLRVGGYNSSTLIQLGVGDDLHDCTLTYYRLFVHWPTCIHLIFVAGYLLPILTHHDVLYINSPQSALTLIIVGAIANIVNNALHACIGWVSFPSSTSH